MNARTIPEALLGRAAATPDRIAVTGDQAQLTWSELEELAERVARSLIGAGVEAGDRVALWAPNSVRWVAASFGVYMAGAALVPLNTRFRSAEAAYVVRASGARALLTVRDFLDQDFVATAESWDEVPALERVVDIGDAKWEAWLTEGDAVPADTVTARCGRLDGSAVSDIIFTSGTTGAPKGAVLTHGASIRTYEAWSDCVGLRGDDRYLVVYPFFHTAGLKSGILACVLKGAEIHPFAVFDVDAVMDYVARHRITMLPGPPTVFQSILDHPSFDRFDLSSLRLSVTGAAVVPVEVIRRMREDLRFETVVTGYGLTETTGTVSMCRHDDSAETIATTVGRPLPGVEVKVVDDAGTEQPPGQAGEILVRGFNVMKEYFHNPQATREAIDADGWLRTGDIGFVGDDGNIRITDRKKDMYISGGFNVYPAEVEGLILRHPAVAQVAVIGVPDGRLGEVGQAVVVPRSWADWDEGEFLQWCRDNMANYKVPRHVRLVEALPLNPSGKVMKYKLREEAATPRP
ncbi:MAG TPA: FadD3 family acyl-CoA ligase [Acidimicrobiales bacterium]|nr:FadD3 family acyl-CoA ligase [Acidimicrobiales bacterium]